jgi:RimJ/RimL family protein N-acetyltransferase
VIDPATIADRSAPKVTDLVAGFNGGLVLVEPLSPAHERGLARAAREHEVFAWLPEDMAGSGEHMHRWVCQALETAAQGREVPFAIVDVRSGEPLGSTRFMELRLEHLRAEIGWTWLARDAWGTGANVETKLMLLSHAFEHAGLRRVEFKTDARNERSRGALAALGAKFEGILRKHMVIAGGQPRDSAYYSVIDDEWPAVKARLQQRLAERRRR